VSVGGSGEVGAAQRRVPVGRGSAAVAQVGRGLRRALDSVTTSRSPNCFTDPFSTLCGRTSMITRRRVRHSRAECHCRRGPRLGCRIGVSTD
jgi:hypothetical protein